MYGSNRRTWAKINLNAISENVDIINKLLYSKSKLMAIVKADAYGHGAPFIAKELEAAGVGFFGVSSLDEAVQLRENDISKDILILGYTMPFEEDIEKLMNYNITQTVFDVGYAETISSIAERHKKKIKVHIKCDTGMNRLGFKYTSKNKDPNTVANIKKVALLSGLIPEGIYTHFATSYDIKSDYTHIQFELFTELLSELEKKGLYFKIKHTANSAATINFKETYLDYVRCGLILYGLYPSKAVPRIGLKPAMELKTTISQLHTVKEGETVSYSRTYEAGKDISVATLPIGYADGFSRLLSNSASVIINGKKAPVIGRVCMDQSMVDVTGCGDVQVNDDVTIFGGEHGNCISADHVADMMETINYEVVCLIGKRVPRVFFKDGKEIGQLNYITMK